MLGCVYWGATYHFLDDPDVASMVRAMQQARPTAFISVPKKWTQLYEVISREADPLKASDEELLQATRRLTGGRLRWGLSAAGYLDADIFRFFQSQGVELMSGFGMTEATGGITMTPPGEYRDDSLGLPLPGIETRLAEDGELLIRGPYVMTGYLDPARGEPSLDADGWLPTGDLMDRSPDGHYRLVDRKKEIYKNVKGETIAPQRIENLFRDFESVGRAFLVGDHRDYNTLLIHPNPDYNELDFGSLSPEEIWDHFRSLVVSVNKFLAPYERIVDFAVIDRDLDAEKDELTPKGTPRRRTVVENFADAVRSLYRRTSLQVGGVEVTIPNRLFQTLGLTAQDIRIGEEGMLLRSSGATLEVERHGDDLVRIGSCLYRHPPGPINLGALLTTQQLWLGNWSLVDFLPLETTERHWPGRNRQGITWAGYAERIDEAEDDLDAVQTALAHDEHDAMDLHLAARLLASSDARSAIDGVRLARKILGREKGPLAEPARLVLSRAADLQPVELRREAFLALVPEEKDTRIEDTLRRFLPGESRLLDEATRASLAEASLTRGQLEAFIRVAHEACTDDGTEGRPEQLARSLLQLLSEYGANHPTSYRRLRAFLVRMSLFAASQRIREHAHAASIALQNGFRTWLGPASRIAVDPETGREYRWDDVVVFDDDVPREDRHKILSALKHTPLVREAFFLFSSGALVHLNDIPPGGVWIRLLGSRHGKSVYRITVQTRLEGAYDLAVNVNHSLPAEQVREEISWMILSDDSGGATPLVEEFGGYWPEQDLWSEEFISGETLDRAMVRLSKRRDEGERLRQLWSFLAWSTLAAYVDFWNRSGRRWEIADPSMSNVVVPPQDFRIGARIVSLSARRPHTGLPAMINSLREEFLAPAEKQYPMLAGLVGWDVVCSSLLEVVGEVEGLDLIGRALQDDAGKLGPQLRGALGKFVDHTRSRGFLPLRLHFAVERYRRWEMLSTDATSQARARTLQELYDTYGLDRLAQAYPEVRARFFRETVFRNAPQALADGLEEMIGRLRSGSLMADELIDAVADLRSRLELGPDDDYFLARVSLPYLRPEDAAGFVSSHFGGRTQSVVVVSLEDADDRPFQVRHALSPKEVERLHRLYIAAKLDVRFRSEHQYLVAVNERGHVIAGIHYETGEEDKQAHLEKIVVAYAYRRKGVADGLMKEFFNRLRAAGIKTVTTGFFRPEYFYGHGFRIEKRYAGLVKSLEDPEPATP